MNSNQAIYSFAAFIFIYREYIGCSTPINHLQNRNNIVSVWVNCEHDRRTENTFDVLVRNFIHIQIEEEIHNLPVFIHPGPVLRL